MPDAREAFVTGLHQQYEAALLKSCYRHVHYDPRYRDLAEECVQEAFLLLFQRYGQLRDHPNIGRWLLLCCLNKMDNALYKLRVRDRHAAFSMDEYPDLPLGDALTTVERWLDASEARQCVARIRETLTDKENAVFEDYFLEGLTAEAIAMKRATTVGAVKSVLRKIRKKGRREKLEGFLLLLGILSRYR